MPILCDTHALVWWVLTPERLSRKAAQKMDETRGRGALACADISLWEIAMLLQRGRIQSPLQPEVFLQTLVKALMLQVYPITPRIAVMAQDDRFRHGDPADRIIAATAITHDLDLITADKTLHKLRGLRHLW
ncbi:MAG TPA: type II toxin-antitoxin system VapC family toxin [Pseudomonadales bacterium]|nr:type II toxin-antitoxin system VapC family toxin [Pseudomonadales bacterium]